MFCEIISPYFMIKYVNTAIRAHEKTADKVPHIPFGGKNSQISLPVANPAPISDEHSKKAVLTAFFTNNTPKIFIL